MPEHYFTDVPFSDIKIYIINPIIKNRQYQLKTCSGVFSKKKVDKGTSLLLKYFQIPENSSRVLDMGTGYGIIGIVIATEFPHIKVTMIDINQRAVWIARENLRLEKISNAKVYWGSFYEPVKKELESFDVILTNPPLALGQELIYNFISTTPKYLKMDGYFYLVARTKQGAKKIAEKMKNIFKNIKLLGIQGGYRLFLSQKR